LATIQTNRDLTVLKIKQFLGLNENPDGDTGLKNGEMAEMRNFRITRDKHLQIRPGQKTILSVREAWDAWASGKSDIPEKPRFCGSWNGFAGGLEHTLVAFGGAVFSVNILTEAVKVVGACTQDDTTFFGFGGKVYLLNGHEYLSWDGADDTQFTEVVGYVPTVVTASTPAGVGTALENVNRLSGLRKAKFSPDGTSKDFKLPEKDVDEITAVEGTTATYTLNGAEGKVTFNTAPTAGVNTVTVTYRKGEGELDQVRKMRFAEMFNGATDTRVFLYGDGTNKTIYSGTDLETGQPSAEYFPDLYEAAIGDENTPITAMIRHYSRLMVFKTNSAWSMDYNVVTTAIGTITTAFYVTPVNRQFGNEAPGQVHLLENNPLTLDSDAVYQWKATTSSGNITSDNRNASRVSDRVKSTFSEFELPKVKTFNRRYENEYWFLYGGKACILNYGNDTWYLYTNMPFMQMLEIDGQVYGFREDGGVVHVSRQYRNDDGQEIDAYAETGNMDFDKDWLLKYSPMIFVAIKPESNARVTVTVETNRRSDYPEKTVSAGIATFKNVDFAHFSFGTNRKPQVRRLKMKVKKATFYKLIFKSFSASATATVLEADVNLRYAGKVK
jgi:hypothetical protein